MAKCRTCEAPILWASTVNGKQMPLDEEPSPSGTFCYSGGKTWVETLEDRAALRPTYTSHFATCPDRDLHRKPR